MHLPMVPSSLRRGLLVLALTLGAWAGPGAHAARAGSLYQQLVISWHHDDPAGHDRASFQIPGLGNGDVVCAPNTTWIQMRPSDPSAENDFWTVLSQTKDGQFETAVREARVYRYSTPTSTVPHGTGTSAYIGFNTATPVEASGSGSLIGLFSRRSALNQSAGASSTPTSVHLSWSWSGFGTAQAACHVSATFITAIGGRSRRIAEGVDVGLPKASSIGPVNYFGINWHGVNDYPNALAWPSSLNVPGEGTLSGTCETGPGGEESLTLTPPAGSDPYLAVTTYQGEGTDNAEVDDYYTDPDTGRLGPVPLPVNGFLDAQLLPAWDAPASEQTELLASAMEVTNDPTGANDLCQIAVQAISAPDPLF